MFEQHLAWRRCVLMGTLALLVACGPAKYAARSAVTLEPGRSQQMKIYADGAWQDTGVAVETGRTYDVRAEGRWSMGPTCGVSDANGVGHNRLFCAGSEPVPGHPTATLIGRIGPSGTPFVVGSRHTLRPGRSGHLQMGVNANAMFFDNTGSMTVSIAREETAPPQPVAIAPPSTPVQAEPSASAFPRAPVAVSFRASSSHPDDIAVLIGNADYSKLGKDIPNVTPAYADAEGIKLYVTQALGIKEGNVIFLHDATSAQMVRVFGSEKDHKGQLFDWVKPGRSRVFIYYAGHGAPARDDGSAYLVPADADAARIQLNGYQLATLYGNLGKVPAKSITVVLEACFSGASQGGTVIRQASPVFLSPKTPPVPKNITVIAAGAPDQLASWEEDSSHGLFTKYFLKGMSGEADKNGDSVVGLDELGDYLKDTMTYYARRYYGRDQTAQIVVGQ